MRKNRLLLSTVALAAAMSTVAIIPTTSAQAATNGLSIRTLTKNVVQGDTARVKGRLLSGKGGVSLTIQQRAPQTGKDWGSGRTVKTDKNGKFLLDRVIKGKFTRDYRVCQGAPGRRSCSLRARIQVTPRVVGIFGQQISNVVEAGGAMTVRGSTDAALAGRVVELQQLNPANLKYYTIATTTVTPGSTFQVSGLPLISGIKSSTFKLYSPPFAGRSQVTVSNTFDRTVFAFFPLQNYPAVSGGYVAGTPTQQKPAGSQPASETFTNAVTPAADNTFTVQLDGNCNRFLADVFVADTATAQDEMNASVVTSVGANEIQPPRYATANPLRKGQPLRSIDVRLGVATSMRVTQSAANGANTDPVWFANPALACAY